LTFGESGHVADIAAIALGSVLSKYMGRPAAIWDFLLEDKASRRDAVKLWKEAMELLGYDMSAVQKPVDALKQYDSYFS
jgi:hypothetical protein